MENRFGWGSTPLLHILSDTAIDAPGTGKRIWITDLFIECAVNTTLALKEPDGGEFITPAINKIDHTFDAPIKIAENKGVDINKTGAGLAVIMIGYYIEGADHN